MGKKEHWGSRIGLVLAMAGNAVGLGNFLRFPMQAVQNGGGAFIIPYLVCFLLMGIPLLWIEWSIGRYGGRNGDHSTPFMFERIGKNRFWKYIGAFGIFTNIAVASYYCYIESWTLSYAYHSLIQTFSGLSQTQVAQFFSTYVDVLTSTTGIPFEGIIFYVLCLVLNIYILSRGLEKGIELTAKIGMPILIVFGIFLAIRGWTLGTSGSSAGCTDCDAFAGFNFLWNPVYSSLYDPKVWVAAAGQIFFTLSIGMGTIHSYAAYVRSHDDIALSAMSAGWMNGFVEVVLGAAIIIPISVGYLGLDWVKQNAGFAMGFQTMPYLFSQWGATLGTIGGFMWFGLLFFAGITSSLAMGTPWVAFMKDEFKWSQVKSSWTFGLVVLIMGIPTVIFFKNGVFDEYDYWAGTFSLVIFALAEVILFGWVLGIEKGWKEITDGAAMKVPTFYKFVIKYITPLLLLLVFVGNLLTPKGNDWFTQTANLFSGQGWEFDKNAVVKQLFHIGESIVWFQNGALTSMFYIDITRIVLTMLFAFICILIYIATVRRAENKLTTTGESK